MTTETNPEGLQRKPRKTKKFHVCKNGAPCCYKLRGCFRTKRGILMPIVGSDYPQEFTEGGACKAVARTIQIRGIVKGSLIDDWVKFKDLVNPGNYTVELVKRS